MAMRFGYKIFNRPSSLAWQPSGHRIICLSSINKLLGLLYYNCTILAMRFRQQQRLFKKDNFLSKICVNVISASKESIVLFENNIEQTKILNKLHIIKHMLYFENLMFHV